jgi:hypothetical protein
MTPLGYAIFPNPKRFRLRSWLFFSAERRDGQGTVVGYGLGIRQEGPTYFLAGVGDSFKSRSIDSTVIG